MSAPWGVHRVERLLGRSPDRPGPAGARAVGVTAARFGLGACVAVSVCVALGLRPVAVAVSVITVTVVLGANVGRSVRGGVDRIVGSALGGLVGVGVHFAWPSSSLLEVVDGVETTFATIWQPALAAGVAAAGGTAVCLALRLTTASRLAAALGGLNALVPGPNPWSTYGQRLLATAVGVVVALAIALFQRQSRARRQLRGRLAVVLDEAADVLSRVVDAEISGIDLPPEQLTARLRPALAEARDLLADLEIEPTPDRGWLPVADEIYRDAVRLSVALRAMLRAAKDPDGTPLVPELRDPLRHLGTVLAGCLRTLAEALRHPHPGAAVLASDPLQAVRDAEAALEEVRARGVLRAEPTHGLLRAFALLYDAEVVAAQTHRLSELFEEAMAQP